MLPFGSHQATLYTPSRVSPPGGGRDLCHANVSGKDQLVSELVLQLQIIHCVGLLLLGSPTAFDY